MSPLTNHTTSLELSIALKEAGWPQDLAFFRWIRPEGPELSPVQKFAKEGDFILTDTNYSFPEEWGNYAAPLASELMERMPPYLIHDYQAYALTIKRVEAEGHCVMYEAIVADKVAFYLEGFGHDEILPNALAKLALHLIQEGMMKF